MAKVLIIDDDHAFSAVLSETLESFRHEVQEAENSVKAFELLRTVNFDLVFLDLKLPDASGLEVLRGIRAEKKYKHLPVVIMTAAADNDLDNTIEAIKLGAFDHLIKPASRDELKSVIARALARPQARAAAGEHHEVSLLGSCPAMHEVEKLVGLAATSNASVMISGAAGTGKERVARIIHRHSKLQQYDFMVVNCAAIGDHIFEPSFFAKHKGTIFFDEIGDLSSGLQARLLVALQMHPAETKAGNDKGSVRIISGTRQDLIEHVRSGAFREDLYYRLNVLPVSLPPLAERGSDMLVMAESFLNEAAGENNVAKKLSSGAAKALLEHDWSGNVRELETLMNKVSQSVTGDTVEAKDLDFSGNNAGSGSGSGSGSGAADAAAAAEKEKVAAEAAAAEKAAAEKAAAEKAEAEAAEKAAAELSTNGKGKKGHSNGNSAAVFIDELAELDYEGAIARVEKLIIERAMKDSDGSKSEAAKKLGIPGKLLTSKIKEHDIEV